MELLLLFVASQLHRVDREADAVLLRDRLQYLRREDCRGSSWRAQAKEWSDARKDAGEGTGQVGFVFDHVLRDQRVEMCGRQTGGAHTSDLVLTFFHVEARV